ncbi:hypothetical protein GGS26DRAFT_600752 [Hypomontagnella submonticulosa]|nr:hypothetical protein GGS26DRAFT_600752 [Hypomontagnella submonticulosa]
MDPPPLVPVSYRLEELRAEGLYDVACTDIRELHELVKRNARVTPYRDTLPPKPEVQPPEEDELIMARASLKYLRAVVAQMDEMTDLFPRLAAPLNIKRNMGNYEKVLKFGRCFVRLKELDADWVVATGHLEGNMQVARMAIQLGHSPDGFSEEEIQGLRDEVKLWDEEYPVAKAAYALVAQKNISPMTLLHAP